MPRLFFALLPQASDCAALHALASGAATDPGARPLPSPDLHLTLCFIGEAPVPACLTLLQELALPLRPSLRFGLLEYWPRPGVLCATAEADGAAIEALAGQIRAGLRTAGVCFDGKPFRAHITLARRPGRSVASQPWPRRLREPLVVSFDRLALVESRSGVPPGEPRYAPVAVRHLAATPG